MADFMHQISFLNYFCILILFLLIYIYILINYPSIKISRNTVIGIMTRLENKTFLRVLFLIIFQF
jgi:hypothetical protein